MPVPTSTPTRPSPDPTLTSLSPARLALVRAMQDLNFGRFENVLVRGGEPVLTNDPARGGHPAFRRVAEVKFGVENGPRPEAGRPGDFALKAQVVDLFGQFDRLGEARVEVLFVKHGLPFGMHVETTAVPAA